MSDLLAILEALAQAGTVSQAQLRAARIHLSYWTLREARVPQTVAMAQVAVAFHVSPDTVQAYARDRHRFAAVQELLPKADPRK